MKNYLNDAPIKKKISKNINYLINIDGKNKYIDKKDTNILNGYYIYVNIPKKILEKNIKLIEINPLYKGFCFKANFIYDIEIEKTQTQKSISKRNDKKY